MALGESVLEDICYPYMNLKADYINSQEGKPSDHMQLLSIHC